MALQSSTLDFSYGEKKHFCFPPLEVPAGQSALILGPSGAGKTTFLHLLAGLLHPSSGQLKIKGTSLSELRGGALEKFRARHIGIVFQRSYFLPYLSIFENLDLATRLQGKALPAAKIHALLDELAIGHLAGQKPARCSHGEQQRAAIARALLQQPSLLLADEPTSALDDPNTATVARLLLDLAREHQTALVIVTHDARLKKFIDQQVTL